MSETKNMSETSDSAAPAAPPLNVADKDISLMKLVPGSPDTAEQHQREKEIAKDDLAFENHAMALVTPNIFASKAIKKEKAEAEAAHKAMEEEEAKK
jgi:hypothetical protein